MNRKAYVTLSLAVTAMGGIFLLAPGLFRAQSEESGTSNAQGISTGAQVDQIFAAYNKPDSPGCAVGVIQNGEFVYRKGYGMGSLELHVPLSSHSVFYMGSVSKQFMISLL